MTPSTSPSRTVRSIPSTAVSSRYRFVIESSVTSAICLVVSVCVLSAADMRASGAEPGVSRQCPIVCTPGRVGRSGSHLRSTVVKPAFPVVCRMRITAVTMRKYTETAAAPCNTGARLMFWYRNNENGRGPAECTMYVKLNSAAASVQVMIQPATIPLLAFGTMTVRNVRVHDAPSERALSSTRCRFIDWSELWTVSIMNGDLSSA